MKTNVPDFKPTDFESAVVERRPQKISRPSLSYWQDAWRRLKLNRRALISLILVIGLMLFAVVGPWLWRVDPAAQDVDQISKGPSRPVVAVVAEPYVPWKGVTIQPGGSSTTSTTAAPTVVTNLRLAEPPTTQAIRLAWDPAPGATGYSIYRSISDPGEDHALGLPLIAVEAEQVSLEDRLSLQPIRYWYSVVALDAEGSEVPRYATVIADTVFVVSKDEAVAKKWGKNPESLKVGDKVTLPYHPFGTDSLGRDLLARLMYGARTSLFIGLFAPVLFVVLGIIYGSAAGFLGGRFDQIAMRFADFMVALPFLLFMILFRIAFGIGPGESGIFPMLVALVVLDWPSPARLVRGQILQIREEGYIGASRLLGARTGYLVFRHMIPNTIGVILVTLTFAIPSVIFTEAFLSFIGMGVAPPTPSWGSMANDGIRTMLSHPHELIFPAILISITVLAFNLLGDGLRDALDVRMRGTE
jgi:oligopeptide transport system permease protein